MGTGGGPLKLDKLNLIEEKILELIPSAVIEGQQTIAESTSAFSFGNYEVYSL